MVHQVTAVDYIPRNHYRLPKIIHDDIEFETWSITLVEVETDLREKSSLK